MTYQIWIKIGYIEKILNEEGKDKGQAQESGQRKRVMMEDCDNGIKGQIQKQRLRFNK